MSLVWPSTSDCVFKEFLEEWVDKQPCLTAAFKKMMMKSRVLEAIDAVRQMHKDAAESLVLRAKPSKGAITKSSIDKGKLVLAPSCSSITVADAASKGTLVHRTSIDDVDTWFYASPSQTPYWYVRTVDDEKDANMKDDFIVVNVSIGDKATPTVIKVPVYRNKTKLSPDTELTVYKSGTASFPELGASSSKGSGPASAGRGAKRARQ